MKSKVHIKGHPLHPILVGFPIAFFFAAFFFDVLAHFYHNPEYTLFGTYMVIGGLTFGLLAAVPGLIDFMYTIPPGSSAKKRGVKHGLLNVTVLVVFALALYLRTKPNRDPLFYLPTEFLGVVLLIFSGWLGGTLVYRNQIGVDIRYAGAGKWKEEFLDIKEGRVLIAKTVELMENQMKLIHIGDKRIVVARTREGLVAFDDHCTHRGGSLASGTMICETVQCPWHGSQFDVKTGAVKSGPAKESIKAYNVVVEGEKAYLQFD
jgi:uncharacterized membrane protein/nitrite reductase/ring-hydroxylating ferredoxin subunit